MSPPTPALPGMTPQQPQQLLSPAQLQQLQQSQQAQPGGNPWVVREQPQAVPVPPGMFVSKFAGWSDVTLPGQPPQGGPRWRWVWQVTAGEHTGRQATALTSCDIHPASHAGILIAGLLGRPLVPGENVQAAIQACVGQVYLVSVQIGPKGGKPAVRSVGKPPQM
jgi:hypothetical protein